jgi:hypothetical protein
MFTMRMRFFGLLVLTMAAGLAGCGDQKTPASQAPGSMADPSKPASDLRISGPYTHDNLAIYLIHGADRIPGKTYVTLEEAMAQKKVVVHETGDVNELAIQNVSNDEIYVQSGDIVKGGQQDRTIASDFVLGPKSDKVPIAAFCVESGRWHQRGSEDVAAFNTCPAMVPSKSLKLAVKDQKQQQAVWANVAQAQQQLTTSAGTSVASDASPSSLQLTLENKAVQDTTDAYVKKLQPTIDGKDDVIGYAFAINGTVNSADVYASHAFFQKLWPRLIRASAVEAFAELQKGKTFPEPSMASVRGCIEEPTGTAKRQRVNARTETATYDANDSIMFDTFDADGGAQPIHRNYINKSDAQPQSPAGPQQNTAPQQGVP